MLKNKERYAAMLHEQNDLVYVGRLVNHEFTNIAQFLEWLDADVDLTDKEKWFLRGLDDTITHVAMYNDELHLYRGEEGYAGRVPVRAGYFSCWDNDYETRRVRDLI